MTVIALDNGGLLLHSPTQIDAKLREELCGLGPVVAVVAPSWWHDLYLRETVRSFPEARLYRIPATWSGSLATSLLGDEPPALWENDLEQCHVTGIGLFLDEVVFYHRASRSVIVADLLFNISRNDAWLTRALAGIVIGPYPGCRFAHLYRPLIFDHRRFRASIERILSWNFDQIVVGHGAVVQSGGKDVFRTAFQWLLN